MYLLLCLNPTYYMVFNLRIRTNLIWGKIIKLSQYSSESLLTSGHFEFLTLNSCVLGQVLKDLLLCGDGKS